MLVERWSLKWHKVLLERNVRSFPLLQFLITALHNDFMTTVMTLTQNLNWLVFASSPSRERKRNKKPSRDGETFNKKQKEKDAVEANPIKKQWWREKLLRKNCWNKWWRKTLRERKANFNWIWMYDIGLKSSFYLFNQNLLPFFNSRDSKSKLKSLINELLW